MTEKIREAVERFVEKTKKYMAFDCKVLFFMAHVHVEILKRTVILIFWCFWMFLSLDYDVVLAPVFQNYALYQKYVPVSSFCQNVEKEGVKIA